MNIVSVILFIFFVFFSVFKVIDYAYISLLVPISLGNCSKYRVLRSFGLFFDFCTPFLIFAPDG